MARQRPIMKTNRREKPLIMAKHLLGTVELFLALGIFLLFLVYFDSLCLALFCVVLF